MFPKYAAPLPKRRPQQLAKNKIQEASKAGLSASEWASEISTVVGGKAVGKGSTCVSNGPHAEKVDDAVEAATKYLDRFHL